VYGVECLNLVGGATSAVEYAGPTISEAAECVGKHGLVRPCIDGWIPPKCGGCHGVCMRQVSRRGGRVD
jgi:hypothetical protein